MTFRRPVRSTRQDRANTMSRERLDGIALMFEQLFRFLNFGKILSRVEIGEDRCEHL